MIENNTGARDDWELSCGQYDYLHDERLYRRFYQGDHAHCELCWHSIEPTDSEPSYCTTDLRLWVCDKCFRKYQKLLGWYAAPEYGEPMYNRRGGSKDLRAASEAESGSRRHRPEIYLGYRVRK